MTGTIRSGRAGGRRALLLLGGHVITLDAADRQVQAIGIAGQRIVAVGSNAEVERQAAPEARRIELGGLTVTPGLIDAHVHFAWGGANRQQVLNLSYPALKDLEGLQCLLVERAGRTPQGGWIEAAGWDEAKLVPSRTLRATDLDAYIGTRPAWLKHATGHYGVTNSAALRLTEIDQDSEAPRAARSSATPRAAPPGCSRRPRRSWCSSCCRSAPRPTTSSASSAWPAISTPSA